MTEQAKPQDIYPDGVYPIRIVSEVTGVNAITLRAWERRYGLIKPQRTPKGHRIYSEDDIHRIQQVVGLLHRGVPVSRVRGLLDKQEPPSETEIEAVSGEDTGEQWENYRQRFLKIVRAFDLRQLDHLHREVLSLYPQTMANRQLIRPLLEELRQIGEGLVAASAEYHFFHQYLINRLGANLLQEQLRARGVKLTLAGTEGEKESFDLLELALSLVLHGYQVNLLGSHLKLDALPLAAMRSESQAIVLLWPEASDDTLSQRVAALANTINMPLFVYSESGIPDISPLLSLGVVVLSQETGEMFSQIDHALAQE